MSAVPAQSFTKGYCFPIYPTPEQKQLFERTFGCVRFVYNRLLHDAVEAYQAYLAAKEILDSQEPIKPKVSGYDFIYSITQLKRDPTLPWLHEVSSVALQQTALHLGEAFTRFFKTKKGYPRYKKKSGHQSFQLMRSAFRFKDGQLHIAKSNDPLKVVYSRELPSDPTSLTISRTPEGQYYVSFTCAYTPKATSGTKLTGIDLGITDLATLSDGTKIANPKHYAHAQKALKRHQQSLARKTPGSANYRKAHQDLAHTHAYIRNCRTDQLHKLSRQLVNENQVLAVESLNIQGMIRNRHLSKAIADASWSRLLTMLRYKTLESQHCNLVYIHTYFPSSHLCAATGKKLGRKLSLSERAWDCPHCGQTHDRDINAAQNILAEALRLMTHYGRSDARGQVMVCEA